MRILALASLLFLLTAASPPELSRWKAEASRVTITRDDWGIAHVHGRSDADAVFGMIYAQAEDDFPRIEANYLASLGRTAEAEGEKAIWKDLRARLYVGEDVLKADYRRSPPAMRRLMDAWADGLNYFLATHPQAKPKVLTRFEPWMVMSFTEGSIGGDIERIDLKALEAFYSSRHPGRELGSAFSSLAAEGRRIPDQVGDDVVERQGSNGIAIAPKLTSGGKALLLINPHTSFYFRSELQVTSDEGLDAYGAATWGQFFIYQGFNRHAGWMHTSSGVDNVDEFAYQVEQPERGPRYRFGNAWRMMEQRPVTIRYRKPDGSLGERRFMTYATHRGPIVRSEMSSTCAPSPKTVSIAAGAEDRRICWIAFAMMDKPVEALQQSFLRTKATDLASYLRTAAFKANSSNDTLFADDKGEIAYLHPQFVPRRDDRFDYTRPVDGSDPASDWRGEHTLGELPSVLNPHSGWVQNTNAWPYRAAGPDSADPARFPRYMDMFGENYRGIHAQQLLTGSSGWTLEKLRAAAYDSAQPGFAALIPPLVQAYDGLPAADPRRAALAGPIAVLRGWDYRWAADSVATSLAMFWGAELKKALNAPKSEPGNKVMMRLGRDTTPGQKLDSLAAAVARLERDFGRWQVPWGHINRIQRLSGAIDPPYSDAAPSLAVAFTEGSYGSLASLRSSPRPGTRRWYGDYGNSFVAVVEFGPIGPRARAVTAGGESGNPASPHFNDEAQRYASGDLREVYFTPGQLAGHIERVYRPGE